MAISFPSSPSLNQVYSANTKSWIWTGTAWKAISSGSSISTTKRANTIASGGQTLFTAPTYTQGANQISVFINGVRQYVTDYAETSNSSITLTNGTTSGDNVLIEVNGYVSSSVSVNTPSIIDDNVSNVKLYPLLSQTNSGSLTTVNTASADLTFNPSTNILTAPTLTANNINIGSTNVMDYIITYNLAFG